MMFLALLCPLTVSNSVRLKNYFMRRVVLNYLVEEHPEFLVSCDRNMETIYLFLLVLTFVPRSV